MNLYVISLTKSLSNVTANGPPALLRNRLAYEAMPLIKTALKLSRVWRTSVGKGFVVSSAVILPPDISSMLPPRSTIAIEGFGEKGTPPNAAPIKVENCSLYGSPASTSNGLLNAKAKSLPLVVPTNSST